MMPSQMLMQQQQNLMVQKLFVSRGWSPKFATGLNVMIGIDQKLSERPDCSFAKMMYYQGDHFGKRTAWSLLYFLNYAYYDI